VIHTQHGKEKITMGDDVFENTVKDFSETVRDSGQNYSELRVNEKRLMQSEAWLNPRHPEHHETKAMVEAIRRHQAIFEDERDRMRVAKALHRVDFAERFPSGYIDGPSGAAASRKRDLLRLYGPKPGKDTPSYRESLTPALRKLMEDQYGPPKD
jgi:hypothetical protein